MSKVDPNKPVLTTSEVVAEFGVSEDTLRRLRAKKKIHGQRFGREYQYLRRVIEAYLAGDHETAKARPLAVLPSVPETIR